MVSNVGAQPAQCPNPAPNPPPVTISATLPADVCIPADFSPNSNPIAFFDDFSWRSFIPMVWPALAGKPGVPDTSKSVGDVGSPLVFETFKPDWDVFQPQGAPPAPWGQVSSQNPCNQANLKPGDLVLAAYSKFNNLGQAGFGTLAGALPAQNKTYTRYLTSFNQVEFDPILSQGLYLQQNLTSPLTFKPDAQQNNPIDVKSAWIDMTNVSHPNRYYTRQAWVMDVGTGTCSQMTVGLVGLHIVTKTPSRPQWIWSTFEQVDNLNEQGAGAQSPFTYNDGTATPMPASNPVPCCPPPATPPTVYNVTRTFPIASSTQGTDSQYQQALAGKGTGVWQFYRLIMTQWPINPNSTDPGTPKFTFPGTNPSSAFSNVTMETFEQGSINSGCMNCHNQTLSNPPSGNPAPTDFLWSLALNASPSPLDATPSQPRMTRRKAPVSEPKGLANLHALLKQAAAAHAAAAKAKATRPAASKSAATKSAAAKPDAAKPKAMTSAPPSKKPDQ